MTKKTQYILVFSFAIIALTGFVFSFFYIRTHNFIETTGVYFTGIDKDSLSTVSFKAYNKKAEFVTDLYVLEHYRPSDTYIYDVWRYDLRYYMYFDELELIMPLTVLQAIETAYFKSGYNVLAVDGNTIRSQWKINIDEGLAYVEMPNDFISPHKSLKSSLKCLWFSWQKPINILKFISFCSLFVFVCGFIFLKRTKLLNFIFKIRVSIQTFAFRYRKPLKRVLVFFLGCVFAFLFIEFGLRIIGVIHNKSHIEKQELRPIDKENIIICLGDSFTESIGAHYGYDYPSQLDTIIQSSDFQAYGIYNFGRSGKNSAQILFDLDRYIQTYRPEIIVIMLGGANYWNTWGFVDEAWWESLKTVKLVKLIISNIKQTKTKNYFSIDEYLIRRTHFNRDLFESKINDNFILNSLRTHSDDSIWKAIDESKKNNLITQQDINHIIWYGILTGKTYFADSVRVLINDDSGDIAFFYKLMKALRDKETIDYDNLDDYEKLVYLIAEEVINPKNDAENFKTCLKLNSYLEDVYFELFSLGISEIELPENYNENRFSLSDTLMYYKYILNLIKSKDKGDMVYIVEDPDKMIQVSKINLWLKNDFNLILEKCEEYGITPILMTYPFLHKTSSSYPVNNVIRKVAKENNVILVDNEAIFDTIKVDYKSYFISDGHCNNKGYELIARNLFNVLSHNNLLEKNSLNAE